MTRTNNSQINDWGDWSTNYAQMWLDNDEYFQLTVLPAYFALAEKSNATVSELAGIIRDYVSENRPDLENSLYADLLNAMLTEIDYDDIAADYIETFDE